MTDPKNQPVDNLTAHDESDNDTSRNRAVADIITKRTGLLDLPPEIRLMIFRHVLVYRYELPLSFLIPLRHRLGLLATSRLIRTEARDVFYKENLFNTICFTKRRPLSPVPHITNMIQDIKILAEWGSNVTFPAMTKRKFLKFTKIFGNPSITRGTLTVEVCLRRVALRTRNWFIQALGKFTNFRIIELCFDSFAPSMKRRCDAVFHARECLRTLLEPVLGCAEIYQKDGYGECLRFHPTDNRNPWKTPTGDWADSLDGVRLEWSENPTAADDFETSVSD